MLSRPQLRLLSVLALFLAITHATWFDANIYGRGIVARQDSDTSDPGSQATPTVGGSASSSSVSVESESTSTTAPPSSSSPSTSTSASATPTPSSSSTPFTTPSSSSSTPPPTTSSSSTPSETSTPSSTSSEKTTTSKSSKTTASPSVVLTTIVSTISGSVVSSVSSSTVTSASATGTAALNNDGTSSSSGMSSKTRNTIIGVVVGVGGAIILAGLGIVAYRIWGRKKTSDESDGLMGFGSPGHEKSGSESAAGGPNPFQSTLENYHNPARNGNVNASSNF